MFAKGISEGFTILRTLGRVEHNPAAEGVSPHLTVS
jgi:hypothetical protein